MKNAVLLFSLLLTLSPKALLSQSAKDTLITTWEKKIASQTSSNYVVMDFDIDSKNNIVIAGYTNETSNNIENYFIAKLDQQGNNIWQKTYGSNNSRAKFIKADSLGNIYVTGYTTNSASVISLTTLKLDASGNILWSKNYTTPGAFSDLPNDMILDNDANIYITGESYDSSSNSKIITLKYSNSGELIWNSEYDGNKNGDDKGFSIRVDSNKNVYILGRATNDISKQIVILIKFNKNGIQQWCNTYSDAGSNENPAGLEIANDTVFLISVTGEEGNQIRKSKLFMVDSLGSNKWNNSFYTSWGASNYITLGNKGIYLGGHDYYIHIHVGFLKVFSYTGVSQFNIDIGIRNDKSPYDFFETQKILVDEKNYSYLLLKCGRTDSNSELNTYQIKMFDENYKDLGRLYYYPGINTKIIPCNIKLDHNRNILVVSNGIVGIKNFIQISQYRKSTITDIKNNIPSVFSLSQNYPNPFNPSTTINYSIASAGNVTLIIYDMLGREVATLVNEYKQPGNYSAQLSAVSNQLSSGIYFYRLQCGSYSQTKKLILMK